MLIVNADDLGLAEGVSRAIFTCHEIGIVSSASIMANMPDAANAAKRLRDFPGLGIGVHLNLTEGTPLSAPRDVEGLIDSSQRFFRCPQQIANLSRKPWLFGAVKREFCSQIEWCLNAGIKLTHIDSHHHMARLPIAVLAAGQVARTYGIRSIRCGAIRRLPVDRDRGRAGRPLGKSLGQALGRTAHRLNGLIWRQVFGLLQPDERLLFPHGEASSVIDPEAFWRNFFRQVPEGITELGCHPGFEQAFDGDSAAMARVRAVELALLSSDGARAALRSCGIELATYGDLVKS